MQVSVPKYLPGIILAGLLIAGYAIAAGAVRHSAKVQATVETSVKALADKIRAFEAAEKKPARFDFGNYSFTALDDAVQKLFPAGTPLARVDTVLVGEGKAEKLPVTWGEFARYVSTFKADRWTCKRIVTVKFNSKTKRVISARADGRCD